MPPDDLQEELTRARALLVERHQQIDRLANQNIALQDEIERLKKQIDEDRRTICEQFGR